MPSFSMSAFVCRLFFALMAKFFTRQNEAEGFRKPDAIKAKINETKTKEKNKRERERERERERDVLAQNHVKKNFETQVTLHVYMCFI
jgi:hypothetical protein